MLSWAEVAARGPTSNPTTSKKSATILAAPDNMEAETTQVPDSAPTPHKDEIGQTEVEFTSAMEEERLMENATETEGERPHVEGRRRRHSNRQPPPSQEMLEDRREEHPEKPPVGWQPGNEEHGRSISDKKEIDEGTLGWRNGGTEDGPAPQDGTPETVTATSPKRHKKLKINIQDDPPPVRRRSRSKTAGNTSL